MAIVEDAVRKEANVVSVEETTIPVVVASKHMDGDSVAVLTLRRPDGNPFPAWTPGAHIDVIVTPALTRQYSLCGDPADQDVWQIAVLREPPPRGAADPSTSMTPWSWERRSRCAVLATISR